MTFRVPDLAVAQFAGVAGKTRVFSTVIRLSLGHAAGVVVGLHGFWDDSASVVRGRRGVRGRCPRSSCRCSPLGLHPSRMCSRSARTRGGGTYFNGSMPVFSHDEDDIASFRMITAQFCANGNAKQAEIARAFGVPKISLERAVAHSTPFGHLFHQHPAGDSPGIRPPVPRPFGRGSRSGATQAGHCYSAGTLGVNVRA
jgi:hypothetical protein